MGTTTRHPADARHRSTALAALALLLFVFVRPSFAQTVSSRADELIGRAERGDAKARRDVETLAWSFIKLVAENGHLDPATSRAMARTLLFVEGVLPPLDSGPRYSERTLRSAAVHALESALRQDSSDVWSAWQLERIASYPYIWMDPDQELVVLRTLAARHHDLPAELLLTRIRLELERGSADSAAILLAALPVSVISSAAYGHLAAEVAFAQRTDTTGAAAYYRGAAAIRNSADAAWYTRDLAWIAQTIELTEWAALAPAAREPWLERFWNRRDIADGQLPGTRLPEQFRRWRVALRDYRWVYDGSTVQGIIIPRRDGVEYNTVPGVGVVDRMFPKDAGISGLKYLNRMRPLTQVLDDRGGLVLRHGNPTKIANLPGVNPLQEATFMWATPTGPLIVSFSRMGDSLYYNVVPSQRFGMIARNYPAGDLDADCELDGRLCGPLTRDRANAILQDYTRMRTEAEHSDGNRESFASDLKATVQAYGIPDRGTLVVFAVPAKGLVSDPKRRAGTSAYSARLRVIVGDSASGEFAGVVDTVRTWTLAKAPGDSTQLTGFLLMPTPPGTWSVSVILSDVARIAGTGQRLGNVPVAAFDGMALRLSDPILGSPTSGLAWSNDGDRIPLNPRNAWQPEELAILTYQVDGLVIGRSYETRIEVWDLGGHSKSFNMSIGFAAPATSTRMSFQRELSLRKLVPGEYRLVLRVRDTVTGTTVTRDRRLAVRR